MRGHRSRVQRKVGSELTGLFLLLPLNRRQQRLSPRGQLLIDSVEHEAHPEIVAHDRHDLDGMLAPEMVHHLLPEFTADSMFAKQRTPETDQSRVFVG